MPASSMTMRAVLSVVILVVLHIRCFDGFTTSRGRITGFLPSSSYVASEIGTRNNRFNSYNKPQGSTRTELRAIFPQVSNSYNKSLTSKIINDYNKKKGSDSSPSLNDADRSSLTNVQQFAAILSNSTITPSEPETPPAKLSIKARIQQAALSSALKMLKHDKTPITKFLLTSIIQFQAGIAWVVAPANRKKVKLGILGLFALMGTQRYMRFVASLTTELSFSTFMALLNQSPDRIQALRVTSGSFMFLLDGKSRAFTRLVPVESNLLDKLVASGIDFSTPSSPKSLLGIGWTICYCFFLWKMSGRMSQGPKDEGAGSRKDKMYNDISFNDVAGQDAAKLEVKEICDMLKDPSKFAKIGARLPSGVLLVGPPGSGKTLLARVSAAEAKVPFYACSASDFVEVFVGRGPARVRKLFKQAAENAPCIVFIDEIDSIGRSRRMGSMNSEQESTLNQLLTSMDGLDTSNNGVIVMGATNRAELLDPALLRAGRFDRIVQCPLPDRGGRLGILRVHTRKIDMDPGVDLDRIAKNTPGTCGADLAAICNEAAIRTLRRDGTSVEMQDFDEAVKSYYGSRGASLTGLAESIIPDWMKGGPVPATA